MEYAYTYIGQSWFSYYLFVLKISCANNFKLSNFSIPSNWHLLRLVYVSPSADKQLREYNFCCEDLATVNQPANITQKIN